MTDQSMYVVVDGSCSICGVLQGIVIDASLFVFYTYDLLDETENERGNYADD